MTAYVGDYLATMVTFTRIRSNASSQFFIYVSLCVFVC